MAVSMAFPSMAGSPLLSYMEGPAPEFVSLDDKYICVQCKKLLKQPHQTLCGHRICAPCVDAVLSNSDAAVMCPGGDEFCEQITKESVYPDMATLREMSRLKVYCPYKSYGCNVETQWNKLKDHKESCEYAVEDCLYREFGCMEMIPTKQKDTHTAKCSYKPQNCSYCGLSIATCRLESHVSQECDRAPIPCPYKCGEQSIIRAELQEHRVVCRAKPQECRFKEAGCTFMGSAAEIQAHQEMLNLHLEMLHTRHLKDQNEVMALRSRIMEVEDSLESTKRQLNDSLNLNAMKDKKIEFLEQKVNKLEVNVGTSMQDMIALQEKVSSQEASLSSHDKKLSDMHTKQNAQERKLATVEQKGGVSSEVNSKLMQLERSQTIIDTKMAEIDQRFQHTESTSYDGMLIWKITDYHRRKQEAVAGQNISLYSQPFYSSRFGHKMCLRVYLNGDGIGRGTHMSLFFVLMKGEFDALLKWPFSQKVTLFLMDQDRGIKPLSDNFRPDPSSSSFARPRLNMNIASGCPLFVSHSQLESSSFLKDNTLFVKCVVGETDTTGL